MEFLTAAHTDVGLKKKTNQDSVLVMQAQTDTGPVLMAAICDGMGGLAKGEVASAAMVNSLAQWFRNSLPVLLSEGFDAGKLRDQWNQLVQSTAQRIAEYGSRIHVDMGTTAVVFLIIGNDYYIMNVGDSRVYSVTDRLYQLTKDQTYVQREIDMGRMTPEQAAIDGQRSVLLQCIGASGTVVPDYFADKLCAGQMFLLCCDGFRHVLQPDEIYRAIAPQVATTEEVMQQALVSLTELNKRRHEEDNISAVLIRVNR